MERHDGQDDPGNSDDTNDGRVYAGRENLGNFDDLNDVKVDDDGNIIGLEKRPRGVLSHTDREYLCGLREYEHVQSEANRKQDIRERIANSFLDFQLLVRLHENDEQYKALREDLGVDNLYRSFEALIAYVYQLGLFHKSETLEKLIERGVYIGVNTGQSEPLAGKASNVDVSINIDHRPDVKRLAHRLENGEVDHLTPVEIGVLAQEGKLDAKDLEEIEGTGLKPLPNSSEDPSEKEPDVSESGEGE